MTEKPILFSGAMVQAILAGTKTQTRRVIKLPKWGDFYGYAAGGITVNEYGEARCISKISGLPSTIWCRYPIRTRMRVRETFNLEVTEVRCQRLQDISEEDAKAEGAVAVNDLEGDCWTDGKYKTAFEFIWGKVNGFPGETRSNGKSWQDNPWVFAYTFRRLP